VLDKIIVMLTYNDMTVKDAQEMFSNCMELPVTHWGFKDVGLEPERMKRLCRAMTDAGKTCATKPRGS
jgi:hypothetical protein